MTTTDQQITDVDEPAPFDKAMERTEKRIAAHPNMGAVDLFNRFIKPLIIELRDEKDADVGELQDQLDRLDIPDEDLMARAKELILKLGALVEVAFGAAGYIKDNQFAATAPRELVQPYMEVRQEVADFVEDVDAALLAQAEEDEDDEDTAPETPADAPAVALPEGGV